MNIKGFLSKNLQKNNLLGNSYDLTVTLFDYLLSLKF